MRIYDAVGIRIRKLPATPDKVRAAILAKAAARSGKTACLTYFLQTRFAATLKPGAVLHHAAMQARAIATRNHRRATRARRSARPARSREIARDDPLVPFLDREAAIGTENS